MGVFSKSRPDTELSHAEQAMLKRNRSLVDEETEEAEKRLKAMARNRLGNASLLVGIGGGNRPAGGPSRPARPSLVSGGTNMSVGGGSGNNYTGTGNAVGTK